MDLKWLVWGVLLLVLIGVGNNHRTECAPRSSRTPEEIAMHRHRVNQMIQAAEREELLAIEWLMEDMDEDERKIWAEKNSEQAQRFNKLSAKYSR